MLGWLLAGINNHPKLTENWIFKGGTCLKKCYFQDYRFSEDLDFTWHDHDKFDEKHLSKYFFDIIDWLYETCGILMPKGTVKIETYKTPRDQISMQVRIGYQGPLQRQGDYARVKMDITCEEIVVLKPEKRVVFHPYSDCTENGFHVASYCIEEIFAEKLRALIDRTRPRDIYDVVYFYEQQKTKLDFAEVKNVFLQKCAFKKIILPKLKDILSSANSVEIKMEWHNMLGHQLSELPEFDVYWNKLPMVLEMFLKV